LLGLLALLGLLVTALFLARGAALRAGATTPEGQLSIGLSASVAVLAVSFGTFDGLGFAAAANALFLFIGLAAAVWRISVDEHGFTAVAPFYSRLVSRAPGQSARHSAGRRRPPTRPR
jgi:hypothetical protein